MGIDGEAGHLVDVGADRPGDRCGVSAGAGPGQGHPDVLDEEERGGGVAEPQPLVQHRGQGRGRLLEVAGARGRARRPAAELWAIVTAHADRLAEPEFSDVGSLGDAATVELDDRRARWAEALARSSPCCGEGRHGPGERA